MAGSGRGRGRAAFTFNIEAIGFAKGASLPEVACKPPPLFPSTDNKPVPLKTGEDEDYMLALKQDLRGTMKKMPYFLAVEEDHEVIERYSKKYLEIEKQRAAWTQDWRRLPREMKPSKKTKKAFFCRIVNQILQQQLELVLVVPKGKKKTFFFIMQRHKCVYFFNVFSSMHDCYFFCRSLLFC
ncbi:PREDICTED: DNA-directed RNA polymerase III subunit RPC7 isoform X1 [Tinamus guttatus]|uniref:DNA-directed RNA polymerase III subunit RPC7 isoform X1 n=1 Tax=Tinamus guttatus TaxID=94827 RepID=UPI00052F07C8|nr:PREDICTED: DNA-directed RNA polymerase III subunit RPC7 isoform X1 [Tinamus guttatus]